MSNAERQKLWRQRHPGERRGQPQVRMTGVRVELMLDEAMTKDLRQYVAELTPRSKPHKRRTLFCAGRTLN